MPARFPLALPFAVLVLLWAFGASQRSIWYDEAITLQTLAASQYVMGPGGLIPLGDIAQFFDGSVGLLELVRRYAETDVHPPLYFVLVHLAGLVFGGGLLVARGVSVVLVALSVWFYWWALGRTGTTHRRTHAAIFALSFAAMSSAQDARGYCLTLLLAIAAWVFSACADDARASRSQMRLELGVGVACAGLLYTHYFALFVVVPILAWRVLRGLIERQAITLIGPVVCAALFAPWVPILIDQMGTRPGQMTGFDGLAAWIRGASNLIPAQVLSVSWPDAPDVFQARGRDVVLLAMIAGAAAGLWHWRRGGSASAFARLAVWVPTVGLTCFLAASILLDRWLMTFRYFLFFAPFLCFLAATGAIRIGAALDRATGGTRAWLRAAPAAVLIAAQIAALNFGWEAIGTRGGNYFLTMRDQIAAVDAQESLIIVDARGGRGTVLSAAYTLPRETRAYLLTSETGDWTTAAAEIAALAPTTSQVLLIYTIERGMMTSDKSALYAPIVDTLEAAGLTRVDAPPGDRGARHYGKWVRTDATN